MITADDFAFLRRAIGIAATVATAGDDPYGSLLAIELPAQPPESAPGLGCRHLAIDLHCRGDVAMPMDLHAAAGT